jgi:hypothetical protein
MRKILISVATIATLSTASFAAGNTNTGCGLGSMLIPNQDTVATQVLAATTNGTSGNQTFGITSGSLNCTKPFKLVMNDKAQRFVADNMDSIAEDMAQGKGEKLDTLLSLMNVKDKSVAKAKLKANFSKIYSSADISSATLIDNIATTL